VSSFLVVHVEHVDDHDHDHDHDHTRFA